jgi:CheY-like chemotaxis protein
LILGLPAGPKTRQETGPKYTASPPKCGAFRKLLDATLAATNDTECVTAREGEAKVRILLADDQPDVRSALRLLLEQEFGFTVSAEAGDVATLLAEARKGGFDLVFLDWELPGSPSVDALSAFRACCPTTVVVAMSGRLGAREAALAAGAHHFADKEEPPERLLETIRNVWEGI